MRIWSAILVMLSIFWSLVWAPGLAVADDVVLPDLPAPESAASTPQVLPYDVKFVSQDATAFSMRRGQSHNFTLTVQNIGSETWVKDVVHLGTNRPQDRITGFVRGDVVGDSASGWVNPNRVEWANVNGDPTQTSASSGDFVTFSFWMSAPYEMALGTYREYFRVVADFTTWMEDLGIYWDVTVTDGPYFSIVSQNAYPPTLLAGESYKFIITVQNTGPTTWTRGGLHPTRLGTDRPRDRVPGFSRQGGSPSGWIAANRIEMKEELVPVGSTATFEFWYTVPETMESGTYREYFRPLVEHVGWLDDYGIYWDIEVDNIPPRPSAVNVSSGIGTLTVSWPSVSPATYYTVRFREQGSTAFTYKDVIGTSTTLSGLKGGVPYEIGVSARKGSMESSYRMATATPNVEVLMLPPPSISGGLSTITPTSPPQPTEVTPIGETEKEQQNRFFLTLAILLGIATAVAAGYYAYDWWLERRRQRVWSKPSRPLSKRETPKNPPKSTTRW
jgi:hypothetical protein